MFYLLFNKNVGGIKLKKTLIFIGIVILIMTGCTNKITPETQIVISNVGAEGNILDETVAYDVFDMRTFGFWNLTIKKDFLVQQLTDAQQYLITINGTNFIFGENIYHPSILEVNLPETFKKEEIEVGVIKKVSEELVKARENLGIMLENMIIQATEVRNGTNLYSIETNNYLSMRSAGQGLVYDTNGVFIMPSYIESSEQNIYTVEIFTEAKATSPSRNVNDVFEILKNMANHEDKLSFIHPNGVKQEDGIISITEPDQRLKFRQLGTMGSLNEGYTYNIEKDELKNIISAFFKRTKLPEYFDDSCLWKSETKNGNKYQFTDTATEDVYKIEIPFTDTSNTEIVKNARFDAIPCTGPMIEIKTPENGSENTDLSLTLTWEATPGSKLTSEERVSPNIVAYQIYFAKNTENYPNPEIVTEKKYQVNNLAYGTQYKWKITAIQNDNQQATSQDFSFTTKAAQYNNPTIILESLPNNVQIAATEATFEWSAEAGSLKSTDERAVHITGYTFYLRKTGEDYDNGIELNNSAYTTQNLEFDTQYQWKVKVHQSDGKSKVSNERDFRVVKGKVLLFDNNGYVKGIFDSLAPAVASATTDDYNRVRIYENLETIGPVNIDDKELVIEKDKPEIQATITGNDVDRGFYITNNASITLDGLVITDGVGTVSVRDGGGIFVSDSSLQIRNTIISKNKASGTGDGGGIYAEQSHLALQHSTITSNEAELGGGIYLYAFPSARIIDCCIASNTATEDGGGMTVWYSQYNAPLVIHSNRIKNNIANDEGGGLYLRGTYVLNSTGDRWRQFNVPQSTVEFVENTTENNNEFDNNGSGEGSNIKWYSSSTSKTVPGTLQIIPEEKEENKTVIMTVIFTTSGQHPIMGPINQICSNGSLTINVPAPFAISDQASVTIGEEASISADTFNKTNHTITITGITATENTTVTLRLSESNVPPGCAARDLTSRDTQYIFTAIPDADGSGTAWNLPDPDDIAQATFTSIDVSTNTNIVFKQTVDFLKMTTNGATAILYHEGTTVGELIENLQSTDGSSQTYEIYNATGTLSSEEELSGEATLTVFSEWGLPYLQDYAVGCLVAKLETKGIISWHKDMQEAVDAAYTTHRSTITVCKEIVKEGTEITINDKEMTITSESTVIHNIINGSDTHRGFYITNGASVTLSDINIENCRIPDLTSLFVSGGGIYLENGSQLTLKRVLMDNCSAGTQVGNAGGGIYAANATLNVLNSSITGNTAIQGGGIAAVSSTLLLDDSSVVMGNAAEKGSALFLSTMLPSVICHSFFEANVLPNGAAAIFILDCSDITLYSNVISNSTDGGIFIQGTTTVKNSSGNGWVSKDSPPINITVVENTETENNTYTGNGNWQGADINFDSYN